MRTFTAPVTIDMRVFDVLETTVDALRKPSKKPEMSWRRAVVYHYLVLQGFSKQSIARYFNKSHCAVRNGLKIFYDLHYTKHPEILRLNALMKQFE